MDNHLKLGDCLKKLLNILNISNSRLAKAINVDASLVSKWVNGKRTISAKTNYLEKVSAFLYKNMNSPIQERKIKDIGREFSFSNESGSNMKEFIYTILSIAQQNTIEKYEYSINEKNIHKKDKMHFKLKKPKISIENKNIMTNIDNDFQVDMHNIFPNTINQWNSFKTIIGDKEVLLAMLDLLKATFEDSMSQNDPILITFISNFTPNPDCRDIYEELKDIIMKILQNGRKVTTLMKVNGDMNRSIGIIRWILNFLTTGRFDLFYLKKYNMTYPVEFMIIPNIGGVMCFYNIHKSEIESAFLFRGKQAIEILIHQFNQLMIEALPLTNTYPLQRDKNFQFSTIGIEEKIGDRFLYYNDLSTITMPLHIYKKKLNEQEWSMAEISQKKFYHIRRLGAFASLIKTNKYYDICPKRAVEKLVQKGKCLQVQKSKEAVDDIIDHMENVVYMLGNYDNYQMGLLNDVWSEDVSNISWAVKESHAVILEYMNDCSSNESLSSTYRNKTNIFIFEATMVNAFQAYFKDIWEQIPPINKDKNSVIAWFESQIKSLKES